MPTKYPKKNSPKKTQPRNAFVAPYDSSGRVMVVQDRQTGKWMLPGGRVNSWEQSRDGGKREFWEETGNHPGSPLQFVERKNGTTLFETTLHNGSHWTRNQRFHRRPDKHETSDYGFVNPRRGHLVVTDFSGRRKDAKPGTFRHGTVSHLRSLRKSPKSHRQRSRQRRSRR